MFFVDKFAQELIRLAKSSDQTERMEAAYLIGELADVPQDLLNVLYELIQDEFLEVQTTANEALKKILIKQYGWKLDLNDSQSQ
ncbi:MAG: HEAT repeat domain-containing protein [Methanobacteriota archaeon]|nr:MAG: HEAT repeat domain-containing protein [Euryarchaeota archaeon]